MEIRNAQAQDAEAIANLLTQLGYPTTEREATQRIEAWHKTPHAQILVAEHAHEVIGVVGLTAFRHLARPALRARLGALCVDVAHRRRGVGAALVRACEQLAREWGCDDMEITGRRERPEAPAFYPALGYEDRCGPAFRFMRSLQPDGAPSPPPPPAARR
jgi:predicted N-acetyltransferase YhbS